MHDLLYSVLYALWEAFLVYREFYLLFGASSDSMPNLILLQISDDAYQTGLRTLPHPFTLAPFLLRQATHRIYRLPYSNQLSGLGRMKLCMITDVECRSMR